MAFSLATKLVQLSDQTDHQKPTCLASRHRERNIREIFSMYDVSFAKLSERFFKTTSWPPVHMIADLVDGDHVFCLLYKVQPHGWCAHALFLCL